MKCSEIMKRDVACLTSDDTVASAAHTMRERNVGFLPVCDEDGQVVGTLTDRDIILRVIADGGSPDGPVGDVMTREAVTCRASDDVRKAEALMGEHQKSRIMCVDQDGLLVGVISLSDIARNEPNSKRAQRVMADVSEREARA